MRHIIFGFILVFSAVPVFAGAGDEGGDGATIPDYQELVREGYGPRNVEHSEYLELGYGLQMVPKPTQAYYGKGYTIYYGYTVVPVPREISNTVYAFGYPAEYFRHMMPDTVTDVNLSHYAVEVRKNNYGYGPGDYVAQSHRENAVTTVQSVTTTTTQTAPSNGTAPLPAIGEKPVQTTGH